MFNEIQKNVSVAVKRQALPPQLSHHHRPPILNSGPFIAMIDSVAGMHNLLTSAQAHKRKKVISLEVAEAIGASVMSDDSKFNVMADRLLVDLQDEEVAERWDGMS